MAENILPHLPRYRDHGVGGLQRGAFDPGRQIGTAPELLALPGPEGLERMGGDHEGNPVEQLEQEAAEVGIPGVTMDDIRIAGPARKADPHAESLQGRA